MTAKNRNADWGQHRRDTAEHAMGYWHGGTKYPIMGVKDRVPRDFVIKFASRGPRISNESLFVNSEGTLH